MRHAATLMRFVDAIHTDDDLARVRAETLDVLGTRATIDAAAVCANFQMMTRIADGTGTPLDAFSVEPSASLRHDLDLDELDSARLPE